MALEVGAPQGARQPRPGRLPDRAHRDVRPGRGRYPGSVMIGPSVVIGELAVGSGVTPGSVVEIGAPPSGGVGATVRPGSSFGNRRTVTPTAPAPAGP